MKSSTKNKWANVPIRTREYLGYGSGMLAYQLQNNIMNGYLLIFLTTVLEIPMIKAGAITVVCRFIDACTDLFFGTLGDRTKSRWGSYKPWYVACAVPACLTFWILFTKPSFITSGSTAALVWAYIIYLLFGSVFTTIMQTSYNAFTSVVSYRPHERNKLVIFRQMGTNLSNILNSFVPVIMLWLGAGVADSPRALSGIALIAAVLGLVLYLFCGITIKERVPLNKGKKISIIDSFKVFKGNWTFVGVAIMHVFTTLAIAMFGGLMAYYFIYYKGNPALMTPASLVGVIIAIIVNIALLPFLMKRFSKKQIYGGSVVIVALLFLIGYLLSDSNVGGYFMFIAWQVGIVMTFACIYATVPDAVDFGEWKSGVSAPGTINTVITFIQKATTGIGTFAISIILSVSGFDQTMGMAQSDFTNSVIRIATPAAPLAFWLISALGLFFLNIRSERMKEIHEDLAKRREEN